MIIGIRMLPTTTNNIYLLFTLILFLSCYRVNSNLKRHTFQTYTMGTKTQIIFYSNHSKTYIKNIKQKLKNRLSKLDFIFSNYRYDSETMQICKKALNQTYKINSDMLYILQYSQKIWKKTNGYFDITLGKYKNFNKNTSPKIYKKIIQQTGFDKIILNIKNKTIFLKSKIFLDFGAIAKGYAADELMSILKNNQIFQASIDIGGEILVSNPPPNKKTWKIWLTDQKLKKIKAINLINFALSTSGDFYHKKTTSHIINPIKHKPTTKSTVTVLASTAIQADSLSTTFKAMGLKLTKQFIYKNNIKNISIIFINPDGETYYLGKKINFNH